MKTAAELLLEYAKTPHADPGTIVSLFAEDGVVEAPYFALLGFPWRFQGHAVLRETYAHMFNLYPGLHFENARIICEMPGVAVGEYEFIAKSAKTGREVHQLTIVTVVAKTGKIQILREFQNIAEIALGMLPNGLGDLKIPADRELRIGKYTSPL